MLCNKERRTRKEQKRKFKEFQATRKRNKKNPQFCGKCDKNVKGRCIKTRGERQSGLKLISIRCLTSFEVFLLNYWNNYIPSMALT